MNTSENANQPVTTMFVDRVKPEKVNEYESWVKGIHIDVKQFLGFVSIDVIQPQDMSSPEYIALVKFDNHQNLKDWLESENVKKRVAQLPQFLAADSHVQQATGIDLWFSRPKVLLSADAPPFWKQVVLGVITVYPMILILQIVLAPVTGNFPRLLSLFVSVVILSGLLTYPVMPFASKLLQNWLYPK